jgi:hypothetical protein
LKPYFDELSQEDSKRLQSWAINIVIHAQERKEGTRTAGGGRAPTAGQDQEGVGKEPKLPKPRKQRTRRRIAVFLDGTSNTPEELRHIGNYDRSKPPPITNVVRLLRGVVTDDKQTDLPQLIGYFRGAATGRTLLKQ